VLVWDESLSIDHGEIDRDHMFLFALSNRILLASREVSLKPVVGKLVAEYVDYIAIHFSHEEQMMAREHYPDIEAHIAAHDAFFKRLCELMARFERGEDEFQARIVAYVGTYLFNHIDTYDRALGSWCHDTARSIDDAKGGANASVPQP
jgi:hemerythrin